MAQTVVAVFDSHAQAIEGVAELRRAGFVPDQISIFAPDPREVEGYAESMGVHVIQGGATGAAAGGVLGGIAGALIGAAGIVIPGAGLIIAAGPLVGALVGMMGGATVGGFIGMLAGLGLPEHAAEEYNRELQAGRTLVFVHPEGRIAAAEAALHRAEPLGIHHYDEKIGTLPQDEASTERLPQVPSLDSTTYSPAGVPGRIETAAPDQSLSPADVSTPIEAQQGMSHSQYLDEADVRPSSGSADTSRRQGS